MGRTTDTSNDNYVPSTRHPLDGQDFLGIARLLTGYMSLEARSNEYAVGLSTHLARKRTSHDVAEQGI